MRFLADELGRTASEDIEKEERHRVAMSGARSTETIPSPLLKNKGEVPLTVQIESDSISIALNGSDLLMRADLSGNNKIELEFRII